MSYLLTTGMKTAMESIKASNLRRGDILLCKEDYYVSRGMQVFCRAGTLVHVLTNMRELFTLAIDKKLVDDLGVPLLYNEAREKFDYLKDGVRSSIV